MNTQITDPTMIINFLRGIGGDHLGRKLSDHINCSDNELEKCHDRIQWMFPLHEASNFAEVYPVVNPALVETALEFPEVQTHLLQSLRRMEKFFGLFDSGIGYDRVRVADWCNNGNHNLLRITRIIRSLRLFGLEFWAFEFYWQVRNIAENNGIEQFTLSKWEQAMSQPMWYSLRRKD